jgi:predicted KAP-like P-loop ATPase
MAMDGNQLGQEIANAIMNASAPPEVKIQVLDLWQKIGNCIIDHITKNGQVPYGIPVSTPAGEGKTSGPGSII